MRKNNLLVFLVFFIIVVLGSFLFLKLYLPGERPDLVVKSEDTRFELSFQNRQILDKYIQEFGLYDRGIAIPVKDEGTNLYTTANWHDIKYLEFIYSDQPLPISLSGGKTQDNLSYSVIVNDDTGVVRFHHTQASRLVDQEQYYRAERSISFALFQTFYRVTHFGPVRYYDHEEFEELSREILTEENILTINSK